jgi:16S rRNA pseudouridine516 synthase
MSKKNKATGPVSPTLSDALFDIGFGSRHECLGLALSGRVHWNGAPLDDPDLRLPARGAVLEVDGQPWPVSAHALLVLNKPVGFECSQKPSAWPSVMNLLPAPLRRRGVQPVGRLDQDTTGVLILTDDGALIHRLTHPRKHVTKVYEVQCARDLTADQVQKLLDGVVLNDDPVPVRAVAAEVVSERHLRLSLTEGKYHQVKRMLAAVGNHVDSLNRSAFGPVTLPPDSRPGQWHWLTEDTFTAKAPDAA